MKGDKAVEGEKISSNFLLFFHFRIWNFDTFQITIVNMNNGFSLCLLCKRFLLFSIRN